MKELEDGSVHLVVTSPPYWQLKDYGAEAQIGYNDSYEEYINHLNLVWNECRRVLHDGCRLCVNIGDQFARSVYYGRYKVIPIRTEIIKCCEAIGFDYMGAVIWQKVTTCNTTGGATIMGSFPYPRNGILKLNYEFILVFRTPGKGPSPTPEQKEKSRLTKDEWNEYFSGHWKFAGRRQNDHPAAFPEELPARLVRMFTFSGETVLDPFLGSGTTTLAAKQLGRTSVGYEVNEAFLPTIRKKLGLEIRSLFDEDFVEILFQKSEAVDFAKRIEALPYRFRDPHGLRREGDPKKLAFGSRIDGTERNSDIEYHRVKEVLAPDAVILSNGMRARLIGVAPIEERRREAVDYVKRMTEGQRVFFKTEAEAGPSPEGEVPCYLYLKNKTFINARLIKAGLAGVRTDADFKHKKRFLNLSRKQDEKK
jgi:site-specific DNA-methyltransferase (adenine-specific)